MKTYTLTLIAGVLTTMFLYSCSTKPKKDEAEQANATEQTKKIKVYKAPPSPSFENAKLELVDPVNPQQEAGPVNFKFKVTDYKLGVQTEDAEIRGIANSAKGQHIHFIVNNGPYSAHYMPEITEEFTKEFTKEGNYVVLAFLSRSYHESVKNGNAFVIQKFTVGTPEDSTVFDPHGQHLFYSRPKGTYTGADTEKLMLDFFLYNTTLSPDGNKVRATVNGEEFILDEWAPYYIEGLDKGEVTIKLELIDKDGNLVPGPFNSVERKVTLE